MAKKMIRKRRAPGAGRKPKGNFRENSEAISMRVNRDWLARIDAEAKAKNESRPQMIMRAAAVGLRTMQDRQRPEPTRGFGWLVQSFADECSIAGPDGTKFEWNKDPRVFDALKIVLSYLMEELRPKAESTLDQYLQSPDVHDVYREILATPESHAKHVFWQLWDDLKNVEGFSPPEGLADEREQKFMSAMSRYSYGLVDARRDLGIEKEKSS